MTGTTADGIEIDRDLDAPPSAVFAALTAPAGFARWFGGSRVQVPLSTLDFVAEPGRDWSARMVLPDGTVIEWVGGFIEVVPDERLVLTLTDRPADPRRARVGITLHPIAAGTGTGLHLAQETPGFSPEQQEGLIVGWQSFVDELEHVAADWSGSPLGRGAAPTAVPPPEG